MAKKVKNPRILIVTPEITYLPEGMGNLSGKMSAKAGGMADVSASLVAALYELGADVHVAGKVPEGCPERCLPKARGAGCCGL